MVYSFSKIAKKEMQREVKELRQNNVAYRQVFDALQKTLQVSEVLDMLKDQEDFGVIKHCQYTYK